MNERVRTACLGGAALVAAVLVAVWMLEDPGGGDGGGAGVVSDASRVAPGMLAPEGRETAALPETTNTTPTELEVAPAPDLAPDVAKREPELVIRGRVLAPDETPVEGATLVLSKEKDAPPLDTQISDAEGRFRFELFEGSGDASRLTVNAAGFASTSMGGSGSGQWPEDEFDVRLHWTAPVSGVVRDVETGAPVAHARVSSGGEPVETASDGSYSLSGVLVSWESGITVEHDDYARGGATFLLKDPEPVNVDVELERGQLVECTVVDRQSGEPLQGAEIRRYVRGEAFAHVDGSGRFTMRLSASADHASIAVVHPDYCPLQWSWTGDDIVPGLAPRLPLERPAWIEARIVDADGAPVEGVGVYASQEGFPSEPLAQETLEAFGVPGRATDQDPSDARAPLDDLPGAVAVPVIPSEKDYTLHAWHADYVSAESGPLELRSPDSRASVELVLYQGGSIVGRVTRNGEPLDYAEVRCVDPAGGYLGRNHTSEKGEFRLENVRVGEVTLSVRESHFDVLYEAELTVEAGLELVHDVALEAALDTLEGSVTWVGGAPAVDRGVYARVTGDPVWKPASHTQTDEAGAFVIEVPAGELYDVSVEHVGDVERSSVPAGSHGVDFVLPLLSTLTLELRDVSTGEPVQGEGSRDFNRWLSWREPGAARYRGTHADIDIHGRAEVKLPVGAVDLAIDLVSDGYVPLRLPGVAVPEVPSAHPVEVFLERGAELGFQFIDASTGEGARPADHLVYAVPEGKRDLIRQPVGDELSHRINGVRVVIQDPELNGRRLPLSGKGTAEQQALEPGRYLLMVFPPDLALEPAAFTIPRVGGGAEVEPLEVRWGPIGG